MALRGKVVDFVRLRLLDDADEARRVRQVTVMKKEANVIFVRITVQVIDAYGVEHRRPSFDPVDHITFVQKELGQIRAILAGNPGDESDFVIQFCVSPLQIRVGNGEA